MKNRLFSTFVVSFLMAVPASSRADIGVAREIENHKVHFDSSGHALSPDSKLILDQAVSLLIRMNGSYSLKVVGYTDAKGSEDLNQDLSVQRANSVAAYLIARGIDRNRVLIQGLGRESPVASNDTDEGRMRNRRVEFKFINPDTSDMKLTASNVLMAEAPKEEQILEIAPSSTVEPVPAQPEEEASTVLTEPASINPPANKVLPTSAPSGLEAVKSERQRDTMLASEKKRSQYMSNHAYEDRKRADAGQTYVQVSPMLMTLDGLSGLGAADNRLSSGLSFRGEAGWISFLEESYESFVVAKGYGSLIRFDRDAANLIAEKQKEFTFGGELGLGRYFHPSVSLQISAGYGKELIYRPSAGNIELDNEFIGHAALTVEAIVWRFSEKGDIGLDASFLYYDFGRGILKSGSGYNVSLFVDYDFLRAGFGFSMQDFETTNYDFSSWNFGPNVRLYF
jgi:hypothetical protein